MEFYHGSKNGDIKKLVTSHTKDGFVYATSNRIVALTYAARCYPNLFSSTDSKECFWELKPNLFKMMTGGKGVYIYELEDKNFEPVSQSNKCGHQHCYRIKENVKVVKKEFIPNVYDELLKYEKLGQFKIVKYEDMPRHQREMMTKEIVDCIKKLSKEEINSPGSFWYMFNEK